MPSSSETIDSESIILESFRLADFPVNSAGKDGISIESLGDFTQNPDILVDFMVRGLWLMTEGSKKFPLPLPRGIAARHRLCTAIAVAIKEEGSNTKSVEM